MPPRRKPLSTAALAEQLTASVLRFEHPADQVISGFFKRHPQLGARDRAMLADRIWTQLREAAAPEWIAHAWEQALGSDEAHACEEAMRTPAPMDLRVNTLLARVDQAVASLAQEGVDARPSDVVPEALRIEGRPMLAKTKAFEKGWVEVQDLGSQLLAKLIAAKRGEFIVDFCAGAGGKTLAMGAALKNSGRIYALDVSSARLSKLKPRLARSGLSNVWPTAISGVADDRVKRLASKADAVLVDAPCSGLGTLRRNPDLKWRMTPERVARLTEQQREILSAASGLVKPGGRLVYATCSPLAEETEQVVDTFLSAHPAFTRQPADRVLIGQRVDLPQAWKAFTEQGDLRLWPHRSGTDGFFAAVMVRGQT